MLAGLATALAIISCYGTGLHLGALSLLGISLSLDERAGAGAISVLAALAALLIGASSRRCRIVHPAVVAVLGFALILWTIYGAHSRAIELIGFALLLAATVLDWRALGFSPRHKRRSWIDVPELVDPFGRKPAPIVLDVRGRDEFTGVRPYQGRAKYFVQGISAAHARDRRVQDRRNRPRLQDAGEIGQGGAVLN